MQQSNQKVYGRKMTLFLIWGPILAIPLILLLFALVNTILTTTGVDTYNVSTGSFRQLALTITNFVLGLLGLISVVGILTALPYGIYRLKKGTPDSNSEIVITEDGQKFIKDVSFSPIDGLFKIIMILNIIQVVGTFYIMTPMTLIYYGLTNENSLSMDAQNFISNFDYDAYTNGLILLAVLSSVIFLIWLNKAYRNLYYLGHKTSNTPGWVVGDFFIPIINLFAPYKDMKELYGKTLGVQQTNFVLGWWLTHLLASFLGRYLSSVPNNEYAAKTEIANSIGIGIATLLIEIASLILAIVVLKKITDYQTEKAKK